MLRGVLRGAVTGLLAMHGQGVAHNDLQAENVLLDEQGAKLSDLGVSKEIDPDEVEDGRNHPFYKDLLQLRVGLVGMRRGFSGKKDAPYDPNADQVYADPDPSRPTFESFVTCLDNILRGGKYDEAKARRLLRHPWLQEDADDLQALNQLVAAKRGALNQKIEKANQDLQPQEDGAELYAQQIEDLIVDFYRSGQLGEKMYAYALKTNDGFGDVSEEDLEALWASRAQFKGLLMYASDKAKYDLTKLVW